MGDPTFDKFFASIVPSLNSSTEEAQKINDAGSLLLDQIGVRLDFPIHNVAELITTAT